MGRRSMYKGAVVASLLLLLHVTVCAIQHREYLKAMQQHFSYPPLEIFAQCLLMLGLGIWGVLGLQANFVPIRTTTHLAKATVDSLCGGPDFLHFNTRELR